MRQQKAGKHVYIRVRQVARILHNLAKVEAIRHQLLEVTKAELSLFHENARDDLVKALLHALTVRLLGYSRSSGASKRDDP